MVGGTDCARSPGHCVSLCFSHDADFFPSSSFPLFLLFFLPVCALTPLRLHIHVATTTSLHYFPPVLYAAHAPSTPPTLPFMVRFFRYAFGAFSPLLSPQAAHEVRVSPPPLILFILLMRLRG